MDKEVVDLLILGGSVLTMNNRFEVFDEGGVATKGDKIVGVGPADTVANQFAAARTINARRHIVMPGLIDSHFHTGQQFERGLPYELRKTGRLQEPVWQHVSIPFEGVLSDEDVYLSALFAYCTLLKGGTTCFCEAGGPRPELMAPALELTGIRGILARSTLDLRQNIPPEMHDTPEASIEKGRRLFKEWNGRAGGRIRVWMAMRQIMICSRDLVTQIHQLAAELHTSIHIHLAEEHSEVDWAVAHSGLRPAEYLESIGFLGPNVHAAHSVFLSDRELDLYEQYNVSVAHCPFVAFAFCGPTRVPEMLRRGIRVGLGSDGAPTGNPDLFRQLHLCHLGLMASFGIPYHNPAPILPDDLLRLATIGGAKAISWDEEIGSLEPGKKADLIILSREELDLLCPYDPVYAAAHVVDGADVRTVVVDGRVVVDDGRLVNVNEDELREKIEDRAPQIVSRFLKRMQAT